MFRKFTVSLCACAFLLQTYSTTRTSASDLAVVGFDAPAIIIAEPINPTVVNAPTTGGKLMRLRIPVSAFLSSEFQGTVNEYLVEFECPQQSMRVLDFWPKYELYSEVEGAIEVDKTHQADSSLRFDVSGGFEPFARGNASGHYNSKSNSSERYRRKPPMQQLTSAGMIRRGYGVFYKFRPGATPTLEGEREVALLVEVPQNWRADLLQVSMQATGITPYSSGRPQILGNSRMWIALHQEGDAAAAAQAQRYVTRERALRAAAAEAKQRIEEKSLPTVWHKVGAALEVIEPRIPADFLTRIVFDFSQQFDDGTNRLPIDLRVAALDYWADRESLMKLSYSQTANPASTTVAVQ